MNGDIENKKTCEDCIYFIDSVHYEKDKTHPFEVTGYGCKKHTNHEISKQTFFNLCEDFAKKD